MSFFAGHGPTKPKSDLSQVKSIVGYEQSRSLAWLLRFSALGFLIWIAIADAVTTWILLDKGYTERNALARWQFDTLGVPMACVLRVLVAIAISAMLLVIYTYLTDHPRYFIGLVDALVLAIAIWWTSIVWTNLGKV